MSQIDRLEIPKGSIVGVIGNNGAGKTTFARCLCGLERKMSGKLEIDGQTYISKTSTETMSDKIKRMLKNEIQQM